MCYETGKGVKKDLQVSNMWYEKAANHGHLECMARLVEVYEKGIGVKKDLQKAAYWRGKYAERMAYINRPLKNNR